MCLLALVVCHEQNKLFMGLQTERHMLFPRRGQAHAWYAWGIHTKPIIAIPLFFLLQVTKVQVLGTIKLVFWIHGHGGHGHPLVMGGRDIKECAMMLRVQYVPRVFVGMCCVQQLFFFSQPTGREWYEILLFSTPLTVRTCSAGCVEKRYPP